MTTKDRINTDIKDAMRAKEKDKLGILRLITAAIKQIEVDERVEVDDERLLIILDKMTKQRKESITQFEKAGRNDLVSQEKYELSIIAHYLPTPLTESEILDLVSTAVQESGATKMSDMNKVMVLLKPKVQGRADMNQISALIKAKLM